MHLFQFAAGALLALLLSVAPLAQQSIGSVEAWGYDNWGQATVPAVPNAGIAYVQVSAGRWHSAAIQNDGQIVAWGRNDEGQCNVPALPPGVT